MNKILKILIVLLLVTLNFPFLTKIYAVDSDEERISHTRRRKSSHFLSDSEDDDSGKECKEDESDTSNGKSKVFKYREETRSAVINAVRTGQYSCRQQIAEALGVERTTINGCLSELWRAGLLSAEELRSVNLVDQRAFRHEIAGLVKAKKTEQEILDYCYANGDSYPGERTDHYLSRGYLTGLLQSLYNKGLLNPSDTAYLKLEGTVVARRGETKKRIIEFLKERSEKEPTKTRKKLAEEFNEWVCPRYNVRAITTETFVDHVNELIGKNMLSEPQVGFFYSCKEEKQQDGYIPTSKKTKRKQQNIFGG